jgi:hypothetical protein
VSVKKVEATMRVLLVLLLISTSVLAKSKQHIPAVNDAYVLKKNIPFLDKDQGELMNYFNKKVTLEKDQIFEVVDVYNKCKKHGKQKTCTRVLTLEMLDCGVETKSRLERKIASTSHYSLQVKDEVCKIRITDEHTGKATTPYLYREVAKKSSFERLFKYQNL